MCGLLPELQEIHYHTFPSLEGGHEAGAEEDREEEVPAQEVAEGGGGGECLGGEELDAAAVAE